MSPLRFFEIYTAVLLHFKENSNYDYFKYGGKNRVNEHSLSRRNDRYFFEKRCRTIASDNQAAFLFFSNMYLNDSLYIKTISDAPYRELQALGEALEYKFSEWLPEFTATGKIKIEEILKKCYSGDKHQLLFFTVLDYCIFKGKLFTKLQEKKKDDFLFEIFEEKYKKTSPFFINMLNLENRKKNFQDIYGNCINKDTL